MKKEDTRKMIKEVANKYGFDFYQRAGYEEIAPCEPYEDWSERYVSFRILEVPEWIVERNAIEITVNVTASISKMGGNMGVEDLLKAADEIKRAAEVVKELGSKEMKYMFIAEQ